MNTLKFNEIIIETKNVIAKMDNKIIAIPASLVAENLDLMPVLMALASRFGERIKTGFQANDYEITKKIITPAIPAVAAVAAVAAADAIPAVAEVAKTSTADAIPAVAEVAAVAAADAIPAVAEVAEVAEVSISFEKTVNSLLNYLEITKETATKADDAAMLKALTLVDAKITKTAKKDHLKAMNIFAEAVLAMEAAKVESLQKVETALNTDSNKEIVKSVYLRKNAIFASETRKALIEDGMPTEEVDALDLELWFENDKPTHSRNTTNQKNDDGEYVFKAVDTDKILLVTNGEMVIGKRGSGSNLEKRFAKLLGEKHSIANYNGNKTYTVANFGTKSGTDMFEAIINHLNDKGLPVGTGCGITDCNTLANYKQGLNDNGADISKTFAPFTK